MIRIKETFMRDDLFLSTKELARRWKLSTRTLERWRGLCLGPDFMKIGGRIRYTAETIQQYERGRFFAMQGGQ
jgi:hypothetical protein